MWREIAVMMTLLAGLAACGGDGATPGPSNGAETATAAVEALITAFDVPDFASVAGLAMPGQAALASLAEGASFGDVAEALRGDGVQVSAYFWSGFARGGGGSRDGDLAISVVGTLTAEVGG